MRFFYLPNDIEFVVVGVIATPVDPGVLVSHGVVGVKPG